MKNSRLIGWYALAWVYLLRRRYKHILACPQALGVYPLARQALICTHFVYFETGLVIINISIGLFSLAFFHLLTHVLFKTLLFMCAGGVIHSVGDSQDIPGFDSLRMSCIIFVTITVLNFNVCILQKAYGLCISGVPNDESHLQLWVRWHTQVFSNPVFYNTQAMPKSQVMNFLYITLLTPRFLKWPQGFWKICGPQS